MLALYLALCRNNYFKINYQHLQFFLPLFVVKLREEKVKIFIINFIIKSAENYIHFFRDFTQECLDDINYIIKTNWVVRPLLYYNELFSFIFIYTEFYPPIKTYNVYQSRYNNNLTENKSGIKNINLSTKLNASVNIYFNKNSFLNGELGSYLAGLIESDGSIIIPKLESVNTPTINIIFNIKDKPLAEHIKFVLGYGTLQKK